MILRICICIPTYNNPLTIGQVIDDALTMTEFPVLVVDDGSTTPVRTLLSRPALEAQTSGRLTILRHEDNQGKGLALQLAIHEGVRSGHTHLMAVDGDGQHHVSEIAKMVQIAKQNPFDLIVGNRKFKSATVPGISKFGRSFSNFWVQFQTGTTIADSQSGFRMYPLFFCQNMTFWTRRYDFEIEILIRLMWQGVHVRETEIEVFYPEPDQRVSHFNKLWDNVRISCLNTVFVVVSLLKTHRSPREVALATGSGVFIGCTPFFGFHTAIVALVSFVFRLNAGFLWAGSQISIPPLAPFLVIGSISIGHKVTSLWTHAAPAAALDANHHGIRELIQFGSTHILEWLIGSLILGSVLGFITAAVTYLLARRLTAPQSKKSNWSGRTRGGRFGNGFLRYVLKYTHIRVGYFFLLFIIPYFYLFAPRARRSLNQYWQTVAPEKGRLQRQFAVLRHLFCFGQILMDRLAQSFSSRPLFEARSDGYEHIAAFFERNESVILLGAHVGGWDLAASLMKKSGPQTQLHIVEYQSEQLSFNHVKEKGNETHLKTVASNKEQPIFDIHQLLAAGKPIGLMGDRPLADRFELVTFFGKLAPFDITPFRVAAASRVPLIMTFGFKSVGRRYEFVALPARQYSYEPAPEHRQDRALQCQLWAQEFARELESRLRLHPEQWFNFFEFWSSLPKPPTDAPTTKRPHSLLEELHTQPLPRSGSEPTVKSTADEQ